jgi:nitroreductase
MNEIIKFLKKRRSVTAKKMLPGNVTENDLNDILECALRVPDHGALSPWKLVVIQNDMRKTIGEEILVPEFIKNNTDLDEEKLLFEKNRFLRADKIIAVIYSPVESVKIPSWEMMLSTGAVCQNITIAAQSLNYAVQWVTEWYSYNDKMLEYLGGDISKDKLAGFIYIGEKKEDPVERIRPKFEKVIKFLN